MESSKPSCHAISLTVEIDFSCQRPDWYVEPTLEKWGIAA
nr:MAG TPA: hypothetical protein [Inoviridae sp.]